MRGSVFCGLSSHNFGVLTQYKLNSHFLWVQSRTESQKCKKNINERKQQRQNRMIYKKSTDSRISLQSNCNHHNVLLIIIWKKKYQEKQKNNISPNRKKLEKNISCILFATFRPVNTYLHTHILFSLHFFLLDISK